MRSIAATTHIVPKHGNITPTPPPLKIKIKTAGIWRSREHRYSSTNSKRVHWFFSPMVAISMPIKHTPKSGPQLSQSDTHLLFRPHHRHVVDHDDVPKAGHRRLQLRSDLGVVILVGWNSKVVALGEVDEVHVHSGRVKFEGFRHHHL